MVHAMVGERMSKERGMTLVELLAAIVIVSIIVVPMVGYLQQGRMIARESQMEFKALQAAQAQMETLWVQPWGDLVSGELTDAPFPIDKLRWTVDESIPNLKRVEVRVDWRDSNGNQQSFSLVTMRNSR